MYSLNIILASQWLPTVPVDEPWSSNSIPIKVEHPNAALDIATTLGVIKYVLVVPLTVTVWVSWLELYKLPVLFLQRENELEVNPNTCVISCIIVQSIASNDSG